MLYAQGHSVDHCPFTPRLFCRLIGMKMVPTTVRRFRIERAGRTEAEWLREMLNREGEKFGTRVELTSEGVLELRWK